MKAMLKDGMLELDMAKAAPAKTVKGESKAVKVAPKGLPLVARNQLGQRDQSGEYIKTKAKNATAPS